MTANNIDFSDSHAMYAATRLIIEGLSHQGTKQLGSISLPIGGGTPSRSNSDFFTGNIPWITVADLKLRQFAPQRIVTAREFITEDALKNSAARLLPAGSVVLATRVSVGKIGIAEVPLATNQDFASFAPKPGLNNRFLAYCLIASTGKMQEATRGTTIKGIKRDQLLRLEFPFPDEITQENVVSYLDAVSEKGAVNAADAGSQTLPKIIQNVPKTVARIEELAARIEEARELRRRAVEEANILPYKSAQEMRRKLIGTEIAKPIGKIATVTSGGTPDRSNPLYWDGGTIPWIKTGELIDKAIENSEEKITEAGLDNSSARIFPIDTILVALYGQGQTRGRTGLLKIPAATNQACAAILPNPEIFDSRYIQHWLRSLYHEMRQENRDGAQPNWNGGMIKKIEIALPSIQEQRRIVASLDSLQSKIDVLKRHQSETAAALDALLPMVLERAFRGEL